MSDVNPAGKKRPVMRGPDGRMTPVPWIADDRIHNGGKFSNVDYNRADQATHNHLCIVCGTDRGDDWVYGLLHGKPFDAPTYYPTFIFESGSPSPTFGHPECILKAVLYCPHLKEQEYPAMTQDKRTKLTLDDLKNLTKNSKKELDTKPESFAMGSGKVAVTRGPRRRTLV